VANRRSSECVGLWRLLLTVGVLVPAQESSGAERREMVVQVSRPWDLGAYCLGSFPLPHFGRATPPSIALLYVVAWNLIQVFRDGLISLVVFTSDMTELVTIAVLSYFLFHRNRTWAYPVLVRGPERGAVQA
jgi:hypothetical protein